MSNTLTFSQRFHLDVYGYVLLKGVLSPEEVERLEVADHRAYLKQ